MFQLAQCPCVILVLACFFNQVGKVVTGVVQGMKPYGVFVKLDFGMTGLLHIGEISKERVVDTREYFKEGEYIRLRYMNTLSQILSSLIA